MTAAGETISDEEVSHQVLLGNPDEYELLATLLGTNEKKLSLKDLLAKASQASLLGRLALN